MTVIIDGTAGVTFPVTAGSASAVQASSGRVLQVVSTTSNSQFSTTSSAFVTTGFTLSITPSSTSSKIFIMANAGVWSNSTNDQPIFTIYKNSTNLGSSTRGFAQIYSAAGGLQGGMAMQYLDSPATTSSTSYTVYMRTIGGTGYWGADGGTQVLTLQEIAA